MRERKKEKNIVSFYYFSPVDPLEKKKIFFLFFSFSHNLCKLSLISIYTRELILAIMNPQIIPISYVSFKEFYFLTKR